MTEGYLDDGTTLEVDGLKALLDEVRECTLKERLAAIVARLDPGEGALRDDLTVLAIDDA